MKRLVPYLAVAGALSLAFMGGILYDPQAEAATGKRLFIVFLDETGGKDEATQPWNEYVRYASNLALRMGQGDGIAVLGIDDKAGHPSDSRIDLEVLDPNPIAAIGQKRKIANRIHELKVRNPGVKATDILGNIHTASRLAADLKGFQTQLVFFSDMVPYPAVPTAEDVRKSNISFAANSVAHMFFVNATSFQPHLGPKATINDAQDTLKGIWETVLKAAGVRIETFVPKNGVPATFELLFPKPI